MNYKTLLTNGYLERLVTDILYADLEAGNVDFLKIAYKELGVDKKRIMEVRENYSKISSKATNAVYEDIISIIVEELCRKGNKKLYICFMDFYQGRFPDIKEKFEGCGNDIRGWYSLYVEESLAGKSRLPKMLRTNFLYLYCITYGEYKVVEEFIRQKEMIDVWYSIDAQYPFYEHRNKIVDCCEWLEKTYHMSNLKKSEMFLSFLKRVKDNMADHLKIPRDEFEEDYDRIILGYMMETEIKGENTGVYTVDNITGMNAICKKYHVNELVFVKSKKHTYLSTIRRIFVQLCIEMIFDICIYNEEQGLSIPLEIVCDGMVFKDTTSMIMELMARFWIECYIRSQKELYDEYYKNFSFDSPGTDTEEICIENNSLKEELSQCRKKLQQYEQAAADRRKQQEQQAKKQDKLYGEKIASLEKRLKEKDEALEKQAKTVEDMKDYIDLVESAANEVTGTDSMDISKIYKHKILFVGGRQETVTRLKAIFTTADFIVNETAAVPKKTELIVLMPEHMNHALYYKYIGLAREKGIKVIYCNGTNVETITDKVACSL